MIYQLSKCTECGHQDVSGIGDHRNLVAACTECGQVVCGECWDRDHAETCGWDSEPFDLRF